MNSRDRMRSITSMVLSILLFSMTGAVVAQESAPPSAQEPGSSETLSESSFELGWNEAMYGENLVEVDAQDARGVLGVRHETVIADAMMAERDSWRTMTAEEAYAQQTSQQGGKKKGGFRRWMKKYWYIPAVVVAVLVGVESSDDDKGVDDPE